MTIDSLSPQRSAEVCDGWGSSVTWPQADLWPYLFAINTMAVFAVAERGQ